MFTSLHASGKSGEQKKDRIDLSFVNVLVSMTVNLVDSFHHFLTNRLIKRTIVNENNCCSPKFLCIFQPLCGELSPKMEMEVS